MPADPEVLGAIQRLQTPSTADATNRDEAVCLLLDKMPIVLQQHEGGSDQEPLLRHIVKVLAAESASAPQSRWDSILELVCFLLEPAPDAPSSANGKNPAAETHQTQKPLLTGLTTPLSWALRAFVLKCLPHMVPQATTSCTTSGTTHAPGSAELASMVSCRGKTVCEVLLRYSIVTRELDNSAKQVARVAHSSLLALPPMFQPHVAHELAARLPQSRDACLAIIQNPSATKPLWQGFEKALLEGTDSTNSTPLVETGGSTITEPDAVEKDNSAADSARADVKRVLQQYYKAYGTANTDSLCDALIQQKRPKTLEEMEGYRAQVVRPLLELAGASNGPPLQTSMHCQHIQQRVSLSFLCDVLEGLYQQYSSTTYESPHPQRRYEIAVLNLAQDLVHLNSIATPDPGPLDCSVKRLCAAIMPAAQKTVASAAAFDADASLMWKDYVDKIPLPLLECVLLTLYRAVPCYMFNKDVKKSENASPTPFTQESRDEEAHQAVGGNGGSEDPCMRCAQFLKNVVLPEVDDVVFRVSAFLGERDKERAGPQLESRQDSGIKSVKKVSSGDCGCEEKQLEVVNAELHRQLTTLRSIAKLCMELWQLISRPPQCISAKEGKTPYMTPSWRRCLAGVGARNGRDPAVSPPSRAPAPDPRRVGGGKRNAEDLPKNLKEVRQKVQ